MCGNEEYDAPTYTEPIKPKKLPEQSGGSGGSGDRFINLDSDINPAAPFIVRGRERPMENSEPILELVAKYGTDLNGMFYICTNDGSVWSCRVATDESSEPAPLWSEVTQ